MFSWLFGKKKEIERVEPDADLFYGHNLEDWNYVGYSTISYNYNDTDTKISADVFFFCDKEDINNRSYYLDARRKAFDRFEDHPWMTNAELWRIGEYDIFALKFEGVSKWLMDYMLTNRKAVWNKETKWWDISDQSKYDAAKKQQEEEKKPKVKDDDPTDNVVPLHR